MLNLKNKNILVTGGTGFVGSHLIEELIKEKANVTTTFISTSPLSYFFTRELHKKVNMARIDVCNFDDLFDVVTKFNIEYIFHLAAEALVETAFYNPRRAIDTNIMGTVNILDSARLFSKIEGIIIASSDKAYGKMVKKGKYKETDSLYGDHPYEVSKSSADLIAHSYFKTYNLPVVTTRFGNIYGEGDLNFSRIIPGIMKSMIERDVLEIRSDGSYVRDYLYVKDVISGYILLARNIQAIKGEAYNFGSNDTLSVMNLVQLLEKILRKKIKLQIKNTAKNEIPYQSLDFSKIKMKLGWRPNYSLKKTARKIYSWYNSIL